MKLHRTGLRLLAFFGAALCCIALMGCNESVDPITIYDIAVEPPVVNIQGGVSKTITATIEPYFASDMGIIFVKDDPDGLLRLSNHRMIQPWIYAIDISTLDAREGEASIEVMSLDGKIKKIIPVTTLQTEYQLTVRNLNTTTALNADTTPDNEELVWWKGGKYPDTLTVRNSESNSQIVYRESDDVCFPNATIVYLTRRDGNAPLSGSFTWRMKFKFAQPTSTSGSHGVFFGAYLDPTVDPATDPDYQSDNYNVKGRFRVQGIRFITGNPTGGVRGFYTTNGRAGTSRSTNPRPDLANDTGIDLTEEYTLEVIWDGSGRWTQTVTYFDERVLTWNNSGGTGQDQLRMDLADPYGSYYPAFHIAGVGLEILELSIAE